MGRGGGHQPTTELRTGLPASRQPPAASFPPPEHRSKAQVHTPTSQVKGNMVALVSEAGAAASEAEGAPRHGSSARETLDVPSDGGRSKLAGRLSMLHLGEQEGKGGASSTGGAGRVAPSERRGWGAVEEERKQEGPSLMEQMMEEAMAAREEQSQERRQEQLRDTKHNFGGGLKKGFLSQRAAPATSSTARKGKTNTRRRTEKESPASGSTASKKESMPVITGRAGSSGGLEFDVSAEAKKNNSRGGLLLPEVQEAMNQSAAGPLGRAASSTSNNSSGGGQDWLTPELLETISEKPRLAAMLADPRFAKAMQLMSTSPQDALGMFASTPEARQSFTDLMSLLSKHFTAMGTAAEEKAAAEEADRRRVADGPLAQEALRRAAEGVGVATTPATPEEAANVEKVLQQPELKELLMDPSMQRVLQECGEPQALARYMRHPEVGPKLQLMARAGLISFRS